MAKRSDLETRTNDWSMKLALAREQRYAPAQKSLLNFLALSGKIVFLKWRMEKHCLMLNCCRLCAVFIVFQ